MIVCPVALLVGYVQGDVVVPQAQEIVGHPLAVEYLRIAHVLEFPRVLDNSRVIGAAACVQDHLFTQISRGVRADHGYRRNTVGHIDADGCFILVPPRILHDQSDVVYTDNVEDIVGHFTVQQDRLIAIDEDPFVLDDGDVVGTLACIEYNGFAL